MKKQTSIVMLLVVIGAILLSGCISQNETDTMGSGGASGGGGFGGGFGIAINSETDDDLKKYEVEKNLEENGYIYPEP